MTLVKGNTEKFGSMDEHPITHRKPMLLIFQWIDLGKHMKNCCVIGQKHVVSSGVSLISTTK